MKKLTKRKPTVREDLPEKAREIASELDTFSAITVLAESEGGVILIENLLADIVSTIEGLTAKFKTESHAVMIAQCAELKSQLDVLRVLTRAKKQKEVLTDLLADALKE